MAKSSATWKRVMFGEVAECINDRVDDPRSAGVDRYVGLEHLDSDSLSIRRWGAPNEVESTKLRFKTGDIIFGKRRAYQRKIAVAQFEGICSAHAMVLRAKPEAVLPEFLPFFMQSDLFMDRAVAISVGSLSPTINWKTLAAEQFALPPLNEQRRIASVLKGVAGVVDEFRSAASVGRKTRDSLIVQFCTRGIGGESMKTTPIGSVPRSWSVEPVGNRYSIQLGKMMSETARSGGNGGTHIPYLRNANVQWNKLELDDVATMAFTEAEREKFSLRPGDILACEGRHVGKSAIWRDEIPGACYQKALHRLRATGSDVPEFLLHCLYFLSITGRFVALTGETTIPHLPAEKLRAMEIAFPPVGEQKEIAQAIDSFDGSLDALNKRAERAATLIRSFNVGATA